MLKPYNDYKKIKYDWMGSIPVHWDAQKIRELFIERKEKVSDKDYAPLSVSRGGIVPQISTVAKSNDGDNRKLVRNGDFAINSRSDRRGSSGLSVYDGSVSLINIVLCPRSSLNGRYTHYLLKSHSFIEEYYRNGRGIVADLWTTRYAEMKSIVLPLPPLSEQDQIVRYLDWQVSKTNKLIHALKKQIELLKEQKQAVINEAVTKGLNPSVPMKDSGVEWIGEIPEHWTLIRNKNILKEKKTTVGDHSDDFTLLSLTTRGVIARDTSESKGKFPSDFGTYKIVESGNIVFCLFDIDETPRTVGLSSLDGMITGAYDVFHIEGINSDYITYYYLSIDDKKALKPLYTGLRKVINPSTFLRVFSPLPPEEEQEKIIFYLKAQCAKIETLIENINSEITLLVEYRTRLIDDVVTGQIDVRDIEVPDFEYITDEAEDASDDENIDTEEMVDEEA